MTEYYSNVVVKYGKVLYRGYKVENGKRTRVHGRVSYSPTAYLESKDETDYKSLFGKPLQEKKFDTISEYREYVKQYGSVMNIHGYSPNRTEYDFIARSFPGLLEIGIDDVCVGSIDIETTTEHGRMDTVNVPEEIILITYQNIKTKKLVTWGARPSTIDDYILCCDESEVLSKFIDYVKLDDPDIITGWNTDFFDIPYIINRGIKLLGETKVNELSPFGIIEVKDKEVNNKSRQLFNIVGRTCLDLLECYKKFTFVKRVNNKLDTIANVELGVGKLKNPYETFQEFYTKSWDTFILYNQTDVRRVSELEDKLGLISLILSISYLTKINYIDAFSPVRTWEAYILAELMYENIFCSIVQGEHESGQIEGGYVSNPVPGAYDWLISCDAAALYPNIIKSLNISPDTLLGMNKEVSIETLMNGLSFEGKEYTVAANGAMFSKDKIGIIPRLITNVLDGRSIAKKEMIKAKQEKELILAEMKSRGLDGLH